MKRGNLKFMVSIAQPTLVNLLLQPICKRRFPSLLLLFLFFILLLIFSGCSPKFTNTTLPIEEVKEFSYNGGDVIEDKWWTVFEDENLNTLIDSALRSNFDLAATWQQFLAAKATVSREASIKWPQIQATAQTAENFPVNDFRGGENTQLGLSASYELDLVGPNQNWCSGRKVQGGSQSFRLSNCGDIVICGDCLNLVPITGSKATVENYRKSNRHKRKYYQINTFSLCGRSNTCSRYFTSGTATGKHQGATNYFQNQCKPIGKSVGGSCWDGNPRKKWYSMR